VTAPVHHQQQVLLQDEVPISKELYEICTLLRGNKSLLGTPCENQISVLMRKRAIFQCGFVQRKPDFQCCFSTLLGASAVLPFRKQMSGIPLSFKVETHFNPG
jgi:hypothetical protein